jgi:16S rRNA (cytosine1402-N4)-methyltransferase
MHQKNKHVPVLLSEVLKYLDPKKSESFLDVTSGYAGHTLAVLEKTKNYKDCVLVDRDLEAVKVLGSMFSGLGVEIIRDNFYDASTELLKKNRQFDLILADLGVSSPHLNEASRGFAFHHEGPLDMRMDRSQNLSAETVVNTYKEKQLVGILKEYGEEPKAQQIAKLIIRNRPILKTTDLAKIVAKAWPGHSRTHPATRTFQAIRIAVNEELTLLEKSLPVWIKLLALNGRIVVISYHSLEDRLVKNTFNEASGKNYDDVLTILTKKPIVSDKNEIVFNPRARSAKLRAAAKINNRKGSSNANSGT